MRDIVTEMKKIGLSGGDPSGNLNRLFKIHVRRMRRVAQGVQNQDFGSTGGFQSLLGNGCTVGEIGQ